MNNNSTDFSSYNYPKKFVSFDADKILNPTKKLSHSKTSTITDRLYGKYDNLLVLSEDGETNFFGDTEIINMLDEKKYHDGQKFCMR